SEDRREAQTAFTLAQVKCWVSVLSCFLLACLYVGSLYVWRSSLPRDHPSVIKHLCVSVLLVSALSPAVVKTWMHWVDVRVSIHGSSSLILFSFTSPGSHKQLFYSTQQVFYLGPFVHSAMDDPDGFTGELQSALDVQSWRLCMRDAVWLRNQVVAPVTEELVFRGAMLPMLVPCAGPTAAIFVAPLFFGVAHFHHVIEQRRLGKDNILTSSSRLIKSVICVSEGHVVGPVLCYSFCNSQGLPDVTSALQHPQHPALLFSYLMGILLFLVLLFPLTDPFFYGAIPVCSLAPPPTSVC
uniref:CAAX prenyl protease 2 n=1 Tax=Amphiprion percula TaxID=161767 RepID=A0A3P8TJ62_AMPPE